MITVMKDFIFIAGAPGSGKSTVAAALQKKLNSPLFEFGWIPEFRNRGAETIGYVEEEVFAFENLTLVTKNYAKHGFKNVIITDLNNHFVEDIPKTFAGYDFSIFTLRLKDEETLKTRVLNETRSSAYRDSAEAVRINQSLFNRSAYQNEILIDLKDQPTEFVVEQILLNLN